MAARIWQQLIEVPQRGNVVRRLLHPGCKIAAGSQVVGLEIGRISSALATLPHRAAVSRTGLPLSKDSAQYRLLLLGLTDGL